MGVLIVGGFYSEVAWEGFLDGFRLVISPPLSLPPSSPTATTTTTCTTTTTTTTSSRQGIVVTPRGSASRRLSAAGGAAGPASRGPEQPGASRRDDDRYAWYSPRMWEDQPETIAWTDGSRMRQLVSASLTTAAEPLSLSARAADGRPLSERTSGARGDREPEMVAWRARPGRTMPNYSRASSDDRASGQWSLNTDEQAHDAIDRHDRRHKHERDSVLGQQASSETWPDFGGSTSQEPLSLRESLRTATVGMVGSMNSVDSHLSKEFRSYRHEPVSASLRVVMSPSRAPTDEVSPDIDMARGGGRGDGTEHYYEDDDAYYFQVADARYLEPRTLAYSLSLSLSLSRARARARAHTHKPS